MDIKIMTEDIEEAAIKQVKTLSETSAFKGSRIRIMPDVHAGKGSVVGFTAKDPTHIIPNVIGVDIGCAMLTIELGKVDIDLKELDAVIHEHIPSGFNVHEEPCTTFPFNKLKMHSQLKNIDHLACSLGTLGGGNHFIELDIDDLGNKYLVIHTGSRNLGQQVANHYQKKAIAYQKAKKLDIPAIIEKLKSENRHSEIEAAILDAKSKQIIINEDLAHLSEEDSLDYLHDMRLTQEYSSKNRRLTADIILDKMQLKELGSFETMHNYYSFTDNTIRKGAISANKGEIVLIPLNMKEGCIIAEGLGNADWNNSAPHGAGRRLSRNKARATLDFEAFEQSMEGIYTTSVTPSTLDEAPLAYKDFNTILELIPDTVRVIKRIKPIYNFKAHD